MGNCSSFNVNPCQGKDNINVRPHGNASESSETETANAQTSSSASSSTPESTANRNGSVWKRMKKRARRKRKRTKKCVEVAHDQQEAAAAESEVELPGCSKISLSAVTLTGSDHQADKLFLSIPEINIIPCSPSTSLTSLLSSSQISCHREQNELPVCIATPLQVPHRGSEILDTPDWRIPEDVESKLPAHNEDALELSSHLEDEPQLPSHVEEEAQMPSHVEEEPQLPSHVEEDAQLSSHVEEEAQMPSHVEEDAQLSSHVEEEAQMPSHVEEEAQMSSHVEEEAQMSANVEDKPQLPSHVEEDAQLPSHVEEEPQLPSHVEEEPQLPCNVEEEPQLPCNVEDEPQLPSHVEEEPQLPCNVEEEPQLPCNVEEEPQLPSHVEEEAQLSSHVEEEPQLSSHVEEEAQLSSHVEEEPQLPSHVEEEAQLSSHFEEEPQLQGHSESQASSNANTTPHESSTAQLPTCSYAQTESPASCSNITPSAPTEAELSAPLSVDENQSPANRVRTESLQLPDFLGNEAELSAIFSSDAKVRYMSDWLKDVSDLHTVYSDDESEETDLPTPAQSSEHMAHSGYPDVDKKTWYSGVAAVSTTISEGLRSMFGFVSRILPMPTVTTGKLYVKETRSILKPAGATGTSAQGKKAVHWEPGITSPSDAHDYNRVERLLASKRRVKVEKCKILLNDRQRKQSLFADKDMADSDDETQVRPHAYTGARQQPQTSAGVRQQPPKYDKSSIQNMFGGCDNRKPQTPKKYDKKSIQNLFAGCDTEDSNDNSGERAYIPTGTRARSHRPRATPSNSRSVLSSASTRGSGRIQLYFPAIDPRPQQ